MRQKEKTIPHSPTFWQAIGLLLLFVAIMSVCLFGFRAEPHIPMFMGSALMIAAGYALRHRWETLEEGIVKGISCCIPALIILLEIGVLTGVWIAAGVVPSMIYYGLQLLSPSTFLVFSMLFCSLLSVALGSWGVAGTIGIALMGIADGLGIPPVLAAGVVISGAYFGDKLSPISDTMNLTASIAEANIYKSIRFMLPSVAVAYLLAMGTFYALGRPYAAAAYDSARVAELLDALTAGFAISPLLFLPLVLVLLCIVLKAPPIPALAVGIAAGMVLAAVFQGMSFDRILAAAYSGLSLDSGNGFLDSLLSFGGFESMLYSMSLTIVAMMFASVCEAIGVMAAVMEPLVRRIRRPGSLCGAVVLFCIGANALTPEQYLSITIPGRMFLPAFREKKIDNIYLASALSSGALTSALVPWNTCGVFMASVLGVTAWQYGPYALFNLLVPVTTLGYILLFRRGHLAQSKISENQGKLS